MQQLSALVAVVSVAIIGVAFLLISPTWKGYQNTSVCLTIPERRIRDRVLLFIFGLWLLFLIIANILGIYAPPLVQPVIKSLILLIFAGWVIYIIITWIVKRVKKVQPHSQKEQFPLIQFQYKMTLIWLAFCILACLGALFGVAYPMLNIEIGPFNQDNFNWARWFLVDGIFFFVLGVLSFACIYIFKRIEEKKQTDDTVKKKSINPIIRWVGWIVFALFLCSLLFLLGISTVATVKQCHDNKVSFINAILDIPLDVKGSISISGTQFRVTNESDFDWQDITFSLNKVGLSSGYILTHKFLKRGETYTVDITEFANSDGMRFNLSTNKPQRLSVEVYNSVGQSGISYLYPE